MIGGIGFFGKIELVVVSRIRILFLWTSHFFGNRDRVATKHRKYVAITGGHGKIY